MKTILWLAAVLALLTGCAAKPSVPAVSPQVMTAPPETPHTETTQETAPETSLETAPETTGNPLPDPVDTYLSSLTLEQKVGQLFIVSPDALVEGSGETDVTALTDAALSTLDQCPPGGFVFFDWHMQNIKTFLQDLTHASGIPPFLAVDEEGGLVSRLANHFDLPRFPCAGDLPGGIEAAGNMGRTIGTYLKDFGFNLDFAPVADVNTNPRNPIIGKRAFSSDPREAAQLSQAMADGLVEMGIIPTYKHFPGHGDTYEDSHKGLAATARTKEEMLSCEWIPFRNATSRDLIMVGHIASPNVTGNDLPASLSPQMVQDILKGELGFEGLVITDAMDMGAITDCWTSGEAALAALQAGCDLILMPEHYREAFYTVRDQVLEGSYPESRLDDTVRHILQFKAARGLLTY